MEQATKTEKPSFFYVKFVNWKEGEHKLIEGFFSVVLFPSFGIFYGFERWLKKQRRLTGREEPQFSLFEDFDILLAPLTFLFWAGVLYLSFIFGRLIFSALS